MWSEIEHGGQGGGGKGDVGGNVKNEEKM